MGRPFDDCAVGFLAGIFVALIVFAAAWLVWVLQPPPQIRAVAIENYQGLGAHISQKRGGNNSAPETAPAALDADDDQESQRPDDRTSDGHDDGPAESWWSKGDVILTAIFSAGLVGVGVLQWLLMRRGLEATRTAADAAAKSAEIAGETVSAMRQQVRLEQRPWLSIEHMQTSPPDEGVRMDCTIRVRNSGRTPGIISNFQAEAYWEGPSEESVSRCAQALANEGPGERPVAPNEVSEFLHVPTLTLNHDQILEVDNAPNRMFFICRIEYTDVFGAPYISQVCFLYNPTVDHECRGPLQVYKYGNRMT